MQDSTLIIELNKHSLSGSEKNETLKTKLITSRGTLNTPFTLVSKSIFIETIVVIIAITIIFIIALHTVE